MLKQAEVKQSESEAALNQLQAESRQLTRQKRGLETDPQQSETKITQTTQALGVPERSAKHELESKLAESGATASKSEQSLTKLHADLQRAQSESREFEIGLKEAVAAKDEVAARLQGATAKLSETEGILAKARIDS